MLPASDYYGSAQAALPVEGGPTYVQVCVGGVSPWCVNGQVKVPAGGQLKVPTPCGDF
jgi:hypothetical protein